MQEYEFLGEFVAKHLGGVLLLSPVQRIVERGLKLAHHVEGEFGEKLLQGERDTVGTAQHIEREGVEIVFTRSEGDDDFDGYPDGPRLEGRGLC